jgi:Ca2+-binding EF-hand superfamily protein
MDSFSSKIVAIGVACILCGIALAGHDQDDHMKMMDTNSDGKVTATEHAAACKQMFTKMDANGDGLVTAAEMDAANPMMKHRKDATAARNEDGHDKENAADKSYDQNSKMHGGRMMSSSEKIATMDTNGDGKLSAAEHAAGAKQMFSKMDKDADGTLTAQELREGHRVMMATDE